MSTIAKLLLQLLLAQMGEKQVHELNRLLVELLTELALKTETNLDDRIVEIVSRFLSKAPKLPTE